MELYRRARGALPFVFTFISFWVGLRARDFPTERVLSLTLTPLMTLNDQNAQSVVNAPEPPAWSSVRAAAGGLLCRWPAESAF